MALASMSEIFERMARNGQEFWEVVLADDMDERQVSREVGCGLSNKEIAGRLYLSEGTVRNYISSILRKLELRDRTQLAIWAVQNQNSQPEADV